MRATSKPIDEYRHPAGSTWVFVQHRFLSTDFWNAERYKQVEIVEIRFKETEYIVTTSGKNPIFNGRINTRKSLEDGNGVIAQSKWVTGSKKKFVVRC